MQETININNHQSNGYSNATKEISLGDLVNFMNRHFFIEFRIRLTEMGCLQGDYEKRPYS